MKRRTIAKVMATGAVAALCAFGALALSGCGTSDQSEEEVLTSNTGLTGGVAATVNGVEIEEDRVTRAINNTRLSYGYTDDEEWKDYLKNRKYTVESLRYEVLGQLVDQELVKQCSEQVGVTTDEAEIQSYVDKMADKYSSQEAWEKAAEDAGFEDGVEGYKKSLQFSVLEKKLQDHFKEEAEASLEDEATLLKEIQDRKTSYDGAKRTSHILFSKDDQEKAQEVHDQLLNGGISFEDAVAQYSTDDTTKENGGDVGWDRTNSFVSEYTDALTKLQNVGDISDVTESKYGYHIIELTNVWTAPEEISSVSDVPEEFVTDIKTSVVDTNGNTAYTDWVASVHPSNNIQINPMPEDVPYKVDMSDVYSEEEAADITKKAYDKLINGVEDTAEETTAAEAAADTAEAAAAEEGAAEAAGDAAEDAAAGAAEETPADQGEAAGAETANGEAAGNASGASSDAGEEGDEE